MATESTDARWKEINDRLDTIAMMINACFRDATYKARVLAALPEVEAEVEVEEQKLADFELCAQSPLTQKEATWARQPMFQHLLPRPRIERQRQRVRFCRVYLADLHDVLASIS